MRRTSSPAQSGSLTAQIWPRPAAEVEAARDVRSGDQYSVPAAKAEVVKEKHSGDWCNRSAERR